MQNIKDFVKKKNTDQQVLAVILVLYIVLDIRTPKAVANIIDNVYGIIFLVLLTLFAIKDVNPVVGVLCLIAVYTLVKRSSVSTGSYGLRRFLPSGVRRNEDLMDLNHPEEPSLEEETVDKMYPYVINEPSGSVNPILSDTKSALEII